MWFSVCTAFATGGGGGAGALAAALAVLSSAFRNVLMRRKRTTTDFFINPPFACRRPSRGNYNNSIQLRIPGGSVGRYLRSVHLGKFLFNFILPLSQFCEASVSFPLI